MKELIRLIIGDFYINSNLHSTPSSLLSYIRQTEEYANLKLAIEEARITYEDIIEFTETLQETWKRGYHFSHEGAIAAMATVLYDCGDDRMAEELATYVCQEMPLARRVGLLLI
tara:strand:- start:916 stop:1257 length:342 start_codon:yes stop_codon:yes gene_type:complete